MLEMYSLNYEKKKILYHIFISLNQFNRKWLKVIYLIPELILLDASQSKYLREISKFKTLYHMHLMISV